MDDQKPAVAADNVNDAVNWRLRLASGWSDGWETDSLWMTADSFRPNKQLLFHRRSSSLAMTWSSESPYGRQHHLYEFNANCQRQIETNELRDRLIGCTRSAGIDQHQ